MVNRNWFYYNREEKISYSVPNNCTISQHNSQLDAELRILRKCRKLKCLWKTRDKTANYPNCSDIFLSSSNKIFATSTNRSLDSSPNTQNSKKFIIHILSVQDQAVTTDKAALPSSAEEVCCVDPAKYTIGPQFLTTDRFLFVSGIVNKKGASFWGPKNPRLVQENLLYSARLPHNAVFTR